ncbi:MAG: SCO family protein [Reichenbachiella sp.]
MSNRNYLVIILLLTACGKENKKSSVNQGIQRLPYFISADFSPHWFNSTEELIGKHKIPPFSLVNQNGDTINNKSFEDKIYVADFFFTVCPGICPKLTKNMASIQARYENDPEILLLSHTVMPWHDSVSILKEYALNNAVIDQKWNLVTGDQKAIYDLARKGYFADEDFVKTKEEKDFIHTENFILVDGQGHIRGVYNGTIALDVKRLFRHIEILKKEGKIEQD